MNEEKNIQLSNDEKLKLVLKSFTEFNLDPPIAVKNAIEDVFHENIEINNVDFYFKDGIEDLQEEMTLVNDVNVDLNGKTYGETNKVYTYYGKMNISLSEFVRLYDNAELISEITNIDNREQPSKLEDIEDFFVNLVETTSFEKSGEEKGTYDIKYCLRVYCPVDSEEE